VDCTVEFLKEGLTETIALGKRTDRLVFVRNSGDVFKLDKRLSTATAREVGWFYDVTEDPFSAEAFLKFDFSALSDLATGKDEKARSWLVNFLKNAPDVPESRRLRALLTKH
jgi:hypothetical protein